jgi:hypothetical protein
MKRFALPLALAACLPFASTPTHAVEGRVRICVQDVTFTFSPALTTGVTSGTVAFDRYAVTCTDISASGSIISTWNDPNADVVPLRAGYLGTCLAVAMTGDVNGAIVGGTAGLSVHTTTSGTYVARADVFALTPSCPTTTTMSGTWVRTYVS